MADTKVVIRLKPGVFSTVHTTSDDSSASLSSTSRCKRLVRKRENLITYM